MVSAPRARRRRRALKHSQRVAMISGAARSRHANVPLAPGARQPQCLATGRSAALRRRLWCKRLGTGSSVPRPMASRVNISCSTGTLVAPRPGTSASISGSLSRRAGGVARFGLLGARNASLQPNRSGFKSAKTWITRPPEWSCPLRHRPLQTDAASQPGRTRSGSHSRGGGSDARLPAPTRWQPAASARYRRTTPRATWERGRVYLSAPWYGK